MYSRFWMNTCGGESTHDARRQSRAVTAIVLLDTLATTIRESPDRGVISKIISLAWRDA